ncbi:MAG: hypothetical protein HYW24_04535 [Candidatus Aenigmarchaeota archaeon]|nr:hypothetical protein [Candidatus Aenigmarchaeota archaeon]
MAKRFQSLHDAARKINELQQKVRIKEETINSLRNEVRKVREIKGPNVGGELKTFRKEFQKNMVVLVTGAFTFVAALTWNDLVREIITSVVPANKEIYYRFLSAVAITSIAIMIIYILSKFKSQE